MAKLKIDPEPKILDGKGSKLKLAVQLEWEGGNPPTFPVTPLTP